MSERRVHLRTGDNGEVAYTVDESTYKICLLEAPAGKQALEIVHDLRRQGYESRHAMHIAIGATKGKVYFRDGNEFIAVTLD